MPQIMTVTGQIQKEELGFTSMHEHVLYDGRFFRERFGPFLPEDPPVKPEDKVELSNLGQLRHGFIQSLEVIVTDDVDLMAAELADFKGEGGSAVVDMSTPGLRIDPQKTRRVSEKSGIYIIGSTGLYSRDSWPERFHGMTQNQMIEYMDFEVVEGIEGTSVKPGHVKIAIEDPNSEDEITALKAGIHIATKHGLSLTVHQGLLLGRDAAVGIADIVENEKLDPKRTVIAHVDSRIVETNLQRLILEPECWKLDLEIARILLNRGFNVSFDCFGHCWDAESIGILSVADFQRMAGLVALIKEGFADQIVLGTDNFNKLLLRRYGGESYCRLTGFVIPTLHSIGITEELTHKLTVENPANILAY